jgi:hypothetical protein
VTDPDLPDPRLRYADDGTVILVGRYPGHALRGAGPQAWLAVDCYRNRCATNVGATTHQANGPVEDSVTDWGHALCECGVLSDHLATGAARRRWHRRHKARALLGQPEPDGQPAPIPQLAVA